MCWDEKGRGRTPFLGRGLEGGYEEEDRRVGPGEEDKGGYDWDVSELVIMMMMMMMKRLD